MTERPRWSAAGLALAVTWLFVRGVPLDLTHLAEEFVIGLGVGFPIAFALRRLYTPTFDTGTSLRSVPYVGVYLAFFVYELLTANLGVAYRVLHPDMPIEPDVFEFPLRVRSDLAVTTIANSITLTPGTLTMDYDPERNSLYVHAIAGGDRESVLAPIRRWEDYALVIFGEELSPGDPAPDPDRRAGGSGGADPGGDPDPEEVAPGPEEGGETDGARE